MARANYVIIISLLSHITHKLQQLDLSFTSLFKTYYSQQIEVCLKHNPKRNITAYQTKKLICFAYQKSKTAEISAAFFWKAGIFPFNKYEFFASEFIIEKQQEMTPPRQIIGFKNNITKRTTFHQLKTSQNHVTASKIPDNKQKLWNRTPQ